MATPSPPHVGRERSSSEQIVTIKVLYNDSNRRFKLPLRDLKAHVFPGRVRSLLGISADVNVILERYSDSAGSYTRLDCDNPAVYKQLHRAAKAKSKLRIKVTSLDTSVPPVPSQPTMASRQPRHSYLDTVLSSGVSLPPNLPRIDSVQIPHVEELAEGLAASAVAAISPSYRKFNEDSRDRFPVISHNSPDGMFCIDCNRCGRSISNDHHHCSTCENGDYDLCPQCVAAGATCDGESHWLIKRIVKDGVVINNTTETIPPRSVADATQIKRETITKPVIHVPEPVQQSAPEPAMPSVLLEAVAPGNDKPICNGCCRDVEESNLVRCKNCEDYDLCYQCLLRDSHGHHPGHTFYRGSRAPSCLENQVTSRCLPGRHFRHAAVCDGCDKRIVGVRHKCLTCPDWDLCHDCVPTASEYHPGHRFVQIYDSIGEPAREHEIHFGVFCDGPLCDNKAGPGYITGVRYKCAVCDDVDFCASCEALPVEHHNRTHPMVKFKTPVRSVTVSTMGHDGLNQAVALGDQPSPHVEHSPSQFFHQSTEENSVKAEPSSPELPYEPIREDSAAMVEHSPKIKEEPSAKYQTTNTEAQETDCAEYNAHFLQDTIIDGTTMAPDTTFSQTWTLYNPGPSPWPTGCDVRFVGGDAMFDVDFNHPSSVDSICSAMESNKLSAPVEAYERADFTVNLRTPAREGTATSFWRLKLPNGRDIGHRLWCKVQVQAASKVESAESSVKPELVGSAMIFPKLEKESPASSALQLETLSLAPSESNPSECDVLDDVRDLTLDDSDTDAGFLTDEEYDVLDASDQEFMDAKVTK